MAEEWEEQQEGPEPSDGSWTNSATDGPGTPRGKGYGSRPTKERRRWTKDEWNEWSLSQAGARATAKAQSKAQDRTKYKGYTKDEWEQWRERPFHYKKGWNNAGWDQKKQEEQKKKEEEEEAGNSTGKGKGEKSGGKKAEAEGKGKGGEEQGRREGGWREGVSA